MNEDETNEYDPADVIDNIDTSSLRRPDTSSLYVLSRQRHKRRQMTVGAGVLSLAVAGLVSFGTLQQDSSNTSDVIVAAETDIVVDADRDESNSSVADDSSPRAASSIDINEGGVLAALAQSLEEDSDGNRWEARTDYYAAFGDGQAMYSGAERQQFFVARISRWRQDNGSAALELRLNNVSESGVGQCGTELRGSLVDVGGSILFNVGQYPEISDLDFSTVDGGECAEIRPVILADLFQQPFKVNEITEDGFRLISTDGAVTHFFRFDEDDLPQNPTPE